MIRIILAATLLSFLLISSCKKDSATTSEMSVYLQDAPAVAYEKIKIHLKGVSIYSQTSGSWVTLTVDNGIFDLLTLDSAHQAFLGKIKLSEGNISDLQLIIGSDCSVTVAGIDYPLVLDSADLDKCKVKIDHNLHGGTSYKLTIDFKALESIDSNGGIYKLKASLKITVKEI